MDSWYSMEQCLWLIQFDPKNNVIYLIDDYDKYE